MSDHGLGALHKELWKGAKVGERMVALHLAVALEGRDPFGRAQWELEDAAGERYLEFLADGLQALATNHPKRWLDACAATGVRGHVAVDDAQRDGAVDRAYRRREEKAAGERAARIDAKQQAKVPLAIMRRLPVFARRAPDWWPGWMEWEDVYGTIRIEGAWPRPDTFRAVVAIATLASLFSEGGEVVSCSQSEYLRAFGLDPSRAWSRARGDALSALEDLASLKVSAEAELPDREKGTGGQLQMPISPVLSVEVACADGEVRSLAEVRAKRIRIASVSQPLRIRVADWFAADLNGRAGSSYVLVDRDALSKLRAWQVGVWKFVHSLVPSRSEKGAKGGDDKLWFYVSERLAPALGHFQPLSAARTRSRRSARVDYPDMRRIERDVREVLESLKGLDKGIGETSWADGENGYRVFFVEVPKDAKGARIYGPEAEVHGRPRAHLQTRLAHRILLRSSCPAIYAPAFIARRWKRAEGSVSRRQLRHDAEVAKSSRGHRRRRSREEEDVRAEILKSLRSSSTPASPRGP